MYTPFQLVIYAIIALAILGIGYGVYTNLYPPESLTQTLKKGLEIANSKELLGSYYYIGNQVIPGGTLVTKDFFDTRLMSVALECTSETKCCPKGEICSKNVEWDYDRIRFKNDVPTELSVRCLRYEGTPVCRFYFIELPAQAKINSAQIVEQLGKQAAVTVKVENVGQQKLTIGQLNTILYKDVKGDWVETTMIIEPRELESLDPKKQFNFLVDFDFETIGKYKAEFTFEGNNAGFAKASVEMDVNNEGSACDIDRATIETVPIIDSDQFREVHYCNDCDTAYECLSAWNREYPEYEYDLLTKDSVYCIKDNYNDVCG